MKFCGNAGWTKHASQRIDIEIYSNCDSLWVINQLLSSSKTLNPPCNSVFCKIYGRKTLILKDVCGVYGENVIFMITGREVVREFV